MLRCVCHCRCAVFRMEEIHLDIDHFIRIMLALLYEGGWHARWRKLEHKIQSWPVDFRFVHLPILSQIQCVKHIFFSFGGF